MSFCLAGPSATPLSKIALFWERLGNYIDREKRDEWKSGFISLHTIDAASNIIGYSYWATSRWSFFQFERLYTNRRMLIQKMVEIQRSLDIEFMSVAQPIEVLSKEKGKLVDNVIQ